MENKDVERVLADYDFVVYHGIRGQQTRKDIRNDLQSYFSQYRTLLVSVDSIRVDVDPRKTAVHASFVMRYQNVSDGGVVDSGHGIEKWIIIVRDDHLVISSIEEEFHADAPGAHGNQLSR